MGERLRERRSELGLSLSKAAQRASVSASYLTAVESGSSTPSLPVLSRIAHALDFAMGELIAMDTPVSVTRGHLADEPGTRLISNDRLQLDVAHQVSGPAESGDCPVEVDGCSVVLFIMTGQLEVDVDGATWQVSEGDSLHAQEARTVRWSTHESGAAAVWASAPQVST